MLGWFDATLTASDWFDELIEPVGWFDSSLDEPDATPDSSVYRPKRYGVFREGLYGRAVARKLYLTYGGDPAAGVTIEVTLAAETDSAFGITWTKARAAGLTSETDSAFALATAKARSAGLTSETDSALAVALRKARVAGLTAETDSALAAALLKAKVAGLTVETDAALEILGAKAKAAGLTSETDSALAVTAFVLSNLHPLYRPQRYGVFRTGIYNRILPRRLYPFGIADAANVSLLVDFATPTQELAPGLVQRFRVLVRKTDTLNPTVTVSLYEDGALVALLITEVVTSAVGQVVEGYWDATALADPTGADVQCFIFGDSNGPSQVEIGAVAWDASMLAGLAEETDSAFAVSRFKRKAPGLATETDAVLAAVGLKHRTVGQALETDEVLPIEVGLSALVGLASETDEALPGAHTKRKAVGLSTEADSALAAKVRRSVGLASETDTALAAARSKVKIVGLATETDSALPVTRPLNLTVGLASETDSGFSVNRLKRKIVGLCFEYDRSYEVERNISIAWGVKFPLIRPMFRNLIQTWRSKRFPWEDPFDPY